MKKAFSIIVAAFLVVQATLAFAGDEKAPLASHAGKHAKSGHWYVVVCSSRAENVVLQAGGTENDNSVFATWHQGDGQKRFPLPEALQLRTKLYVRMSVPDGKWQTEACVGHDGYAKEAFRFDKKSEDHTVSMDDNDNGCACR